MKFKVSKETVGDYLICTIGALLMAVGIYFFKFPNNFSIGGISGLSIILSNYFHLSSASVITAIINAVLLIFGFILLGRDCGAKTVLGTVVFSVALIVLEELVPLSAPLTDQPFLELFFAVGVPAMGTAMLFNRNGSTGGTDIIAMVLRKYTSMNIGAALLVSDVIITLGSFLFGIKVGLFAILGLLMKSLVVDSVIESINQCKCFQIITDEPEAIAEFIKTVIKRSATIIEAKGAYTNQKKYLVIAVMRRYQAVQLRHYLKENHLDTFMMIMNSSEIVGKGFRGTT
ncbi:MAG TPA: YitT family protein [Oscillospiraceae bacterium]|nr:YitT family protein [Oscillospiraceae bacterium]